MELDPRTIGSHASYKLLKGCVVPRPIAWVSTIGADGCAGTSHDLRALVKMVETGEEAEP
jgi:hypothetical protein